MNWSKEHIEARMLDALEGRLSEDQLVQLQELLSEHPDLGNLDESLIYIDQVDDIDFDHTSLLKKESFNPEVYKCEEGLEKEKMSIAKMEGLLSIQEEKDFEHMLNVDRELKDQWQLVQQTKLIPNPEILFPTIEILKKEKVIPFRLYFSYAAAASVILVLFLNWPGTETPVKTAIKEIKKPVKVDQTETNSQVSESNKTNHNVTTKPENMSIEHIDLGQNEVRDCIVEVLYPQGDQVPNEQSYYLTQPIVDPIELATTSPESTPTTSNNSIKKSETIGIREFVIQKGNEKLFGTSKPSTAEKYTSITNYLAQSVNIPISYREKEDEEVKTTFFKLGFITVERKQAKK